MNLGVASVQNNRVVFVSMFLILVGGIWSYQNMGRLEDPEFTIKEALIITPYPGASAEEVAKEVTNPIESACQQLGQLKRVESESTRGRSVVSVIIQDRYHRDSIPQVWDELRRKIADVQPRLPPSVRGRSVVIDDFGDVYGIFLAITGEGFSYPELRRYSEFLRRELQTVQDVKKVDLFAEQQETVFLEISRQRLAQLGINEEQIYAQLQAKNVAADGGRVRVGAEYPALDPTGGFRSAEDMLDLAIGSDRTGRQLLLRDVATLERGDEEPPRRLLRFDGKPAIGLGISTVQGGNVVTMGDGVRQKLEDLKRDQPIGIEIGEINFQPEAVTIATNAFVFNLVKAVSIVFVVLLFAMGLRAGMMIGVVLFFTILATFLVMYFNDILLERISLGAFIIALCMLTDNAIVVTEGMKVRIEGGEDKIAVIRDVVSQYQWPLFGATAIAVIAFAAIGLSEDKTGEYCNSLFWVIFISLAMSWVAAITFTPLLGYLLFKPNAGGGEARSVCGAAFPCLPAHPGDCTPLPLGGAGSFDWHVRGGALWLPPWSRRAFSRPRPGRSSWWMSICRPAPIFANRRRLPTPSSASSRPSPASPMSRRSSAAAVCASCWSTPRKGRTEPTCSSWSMWMTNRRSTGCWPTVQKYLDENHPNANAVAKKFLLGPGQGGRIQARFSGPDPDRLRALADEAIKIIRDDGGAVCVRQDWREPEKVIRPDLLEQPALRNGITRVEVAQALETGFEGRTVGFYREPGDVGTGVYPQETRLLPIVARPPLAERSDVDAIHSLQIWSPVAGRMIPLSQVAAGAEVAWEDPVVMRRDRFPTITVHADPRTGLPSQLFNRVRPAIEKIKLPPGYSLDWGGEYEDSRDARAALAKPLPLAVVLMVLIVVCIFNSVRATLVICLTVPLAIIGVTAGLLLTGQPFGFMALLGAIALAGEQIKNSIVLVDEFNTQRFDQGKSPYEAIVDGSVSRLRPVMLVAVTTVLGMIPLLQDPFFSAMAVTIMFGLAFACFLTMIVVPVLYAIFFKVQEPSQFPTGAN